MITQRVDTDFVIADAIQKDNSNEIHTQIHEEVYFPLNSFNVIVGQTGCGKTRLVFHEVAKLCYVKENPYHQFIYITDEENDKTYKRYKHLIERKIQIVKLKYKEAYPRLLEIIEAKNLYEKIRNKEEKRDSEDTNILLKYLGLKNFRKPALHTLILFDDATNCFQNKKDPLNGLFLRNRHHKFTYFFNIHLVRKNSIPQEIIDNMKTLWYFGGYNKHNFNTAFKFIKSPIDKNELYDMYKVVKNRDVLYVNYAGSDGTEFRIIKLDKNNEESEEEDDECASSDKCEEDY
jgi:hypothetical protein